MKVWVVTGKGGCLRLVEAWRTVQQRKASLGCKGHGKGDDDEEVGGGSEL